MDQGLIFGVAIGERCTSVDALAAPVVKRLQRLAFCAAGLPASLRRRLATDGADPEVHRFVSFTLYESRLRATNSGASYVSTPARSDGWTRAFPFSAFWACMQDKDTA